jgi:integrase
MAGGLRVSELTHLRWRDLDLEGSVLSVAISKTAAGITFQALRRTYAAASREDLAER